MSQADFAALFNLARPSVGAYEEGRAEPKIDTVIQIAAQFGIGIDRLLTKDITINELYHIDKFENEVVLKQGNKHKESGLPLVKKEQFAQYMSQHNNKNLIEQLPKINLPFSEESSFRAFEVTSAEMQLGNGGLHPDDTIVGKVADIQSIMPLQIYLTITAEHYYLRRFEQKDGHILLFEADNQDYNLVRLSQEEIIEIWQVEAFYSTHLPLPHSMEKRMALLEKQMKEMQNFLSKLNMK